MRHYKNITTLIFDLGGVLINLDINQCILNFRKLGLENFEQYLSNFGQSGFFLQFEKGEISVEDFREEIRKLTTNPLSDSQIDVAWCSFLCDIPIEKLEMLIELKKQFRLLLLSNTNRLHVEISAAREFAKVGKKITQVFDKCYLSYEMKMTKPNAGIFLTLLENEHVSANECLFLDDGFKNTDQAQKLGIQTYLVHEHEELSFLLNPETWE